MKKVIQFYMNKEFLLFIVVGGINTFSGILFSYAYSYFFNANYAFMIGYMTSLVLSYVLNSKITFHQKLSWIKFIKFVISYMPNFFIQNIIVFVVYNQLEWDKLIAYVMAAIIGIPVTFLCMKVIAFSKKD